MQIRLPRLSVFSAPVVLATMLFCVAEGLVAQKSDGGVELHAKSNVTAADVGLPTYPGATLFKDADNDAAVDMGLTFGDFHFKLMAANYVTSDSPAQVFAFYRKPLSRYGEVLECDHGKAVGALTVTRSGLTCSDDHGGHVQVNDSSSSDHELRAGSPLRYRIVGLDKSHPGSTHFGLVYLELPKDSDEKQKQ